MFFVTNISKYFYIIVYGPLFTFQETKTTEEIDEALKIAGNNFEQLSIAVKVSILND